MVIYFTVSFGKNLCCYVLKFLHHLIRHYLTVPAEPCTPCLTCKHNLNRLISITNLMHKFFCSITICMLHYNPRHVSSINMPIFRRTNCIITASGIVMLYKRPYSTESDDTRCCDNTVCPPEDGHVNARNMSRIVM
jgi:hypothetical protein